MDLSERLDSEWVLGITNQKKRPDGPHEIEKVVEYESLDSLKVIFLKLANISISTLGFLSTISLQKMPVNGSIDACTTLSIVNIPDSISTMVYLRLLIMILREGFPEIDFIEKISFVRQYTNYSVEVLFSFYDTQRNPALIKAMESLITAMRAENNLGDNVITIELQMRPINILEVSRKLNFKNTIDSAITCYHKNH